MGEDTGRAVGDGGKGPGGCPLVGEEWDKRLAALAEKIDLGTLLTLGLDDCNPDAWPADPATWLKEVQREQPASAQKPGGAALNSRAPVKRELNKHEEADAPQRATSRRKIDFGAPHVDFLPPPVRRKVEYWDDVGGPGVGPALL